MLELRRKVFTIFFIVFTSFTYNSLAKSKICEIKFDVKSNATILEKKINLATFRNKSVTKSLFKCYQIGLEHNVKREPLIDKPIYACCRTI